MKKLTFVCVLLCSLDLVNVWGMNPNQQQAGIENVADPNNQMGEIEVNTEEINGNETVRNPQQRKVAILCGLTSVFFNCTSLLLATAASFGVYQHEVDPVDNFKKMAKTIAVFIGIGACIDALLSHTPITCLHHVGCGVSCLLSLTIPAIGIVLARHRESSVVGRSLIDSLELFLVEWITYLFATLGGTSLFSSLRLFWRR